MHWQGELLHIHIATKASAPMDALSEARLVAGRRAGRRPVRDAPRNLLEEIRFRSGASIDAILIENQRGHHENQRGHRFHLEPAKLKRKFMVVVCTTSPRPSSTVPGRTITSARQLD